MRYGKVYFRASLGSDGRNLYAIDALTGVIWTGFPVETPSALGADDSNVVIGYGRIYVGSDPWRGFYAFNAWSGAAVPNFSPSVATSYRDNNVLANGLLLGSYTRVFAVDASTGELLWNQALAVSAFSGPPVVVDGMLYTTVSTKNVAGGFVGGFLYAYEIPEPARLRTIRSGHALKQAPAIASLKPDRNRIAAASVVDLTGR